MATNINIPNNQPSSDSGNLVSIGMILGILALLAVIGIWILYTKGYIGNRNVDYITNIFLFKTYIGNSSILVELKN